MSNLTETLRNKREELDVKDLEAEHEIKQTVLKAINRCIPYLIYMAFFIIILSVVVFLVLFIHGFLNLNQKERWLRVEVAATYIGTFLIGCMTRFIKSPQEKNKTI